MSDTKDWFDVAAELAYQEFVDQGGLDVVRVVNEDWERMQRQANSCKHGLPLKQCQECWKARKRFNEY